MRVSGTKTKEMGLGMKGSAMVTCMKVNILKARSMAKASTCGLAVSNTRGSGL